MSDDAWLGRRTALHDRYLDVAHVGDASRLAYLRGPETVWTEEDVARLWTRAVRAPVTAMEPLNCVYVHVPFCKSICTFCNYDRLQPSSPALLKTWLTRVLRSIDVIAPAVRPLTFHALYIGGGTPSVLPAALLHEVLEALDRRLTWHPRAQRKLEFDPAVMNRERLKVLAAHGLKQLSFGIETLDPEVTGRHNRGRQDIEMIERCFEDLRAVGISDVACDFLLGLEGTTPDGILAEMETVLRRFQPAWIDIFMLTPTHSYVSRHFGNSWEAFWAHIRRFEEVVPAALPALAARTGYRVRTGHGHHMRLKRHTSALRSLFTMARGGFPILRWPTAHRELFYTAQTSEARRPLNVVGFGRSARSLIFGTASFAAHDPGDNPVLEGPADYVGHATTVADEARGFLVHVLRDRDTIDRGEFAQIFGGDMAEIIPTAIAGWASEGTARLDDAGLHFRPQDRRERIRSLLWLVPEEAIEFDLGHFDQLELSPSGIARLTEPIKPGTNFANGHTFEGTDGTRLLLRTLEGETLRFRVAPELTDGAPLRLVLETAPERADEDALRQAVAQLCGLLTRRHRMLSNRPAARHDR